MAKSYDPEDNFVLLSLSKTDLVDVYRKELEKNPGNAELLIKVTQDLISNARKENSDSLFGKIESILVKYKNIVIKNNTLKILYADVLQHRHAFAKAKQYLNKINTASASLMRATIHQNLGEYTQASSECSKLMGKLNIIIASTCLVHAKSYQGNLKRSYDSLKKISLQTSVGDKDTRVWINTALADMANRLGKFDESLEYYQQAYLLRPDNAHIISEWVDVLFSLNKQEKILQLLENNHSDMRLNLRYQRSLNATNTFDNSIHSIGLNKLHEMIAITELRKDQRHYDTRAEYYIWIRKDSAKALHWAKKNWMVSKTPYAAKLLLMAAETKGHTQYVSEVKAWFENNNLEDKTLAKLLAFLATSEVVV